MRAKFTLQNNFGAYHYPVKLAIMHIFYFPVFAIMLCALLLSGCMGNVVNLSYPPLQEPLAAVTENGLTVCVVDFANKRETGPIGKRQNGEAILPRTPVERWLASGVAEELRRAGYRVVMKETLAEALATGSDYIVAGEAEEVRLMENSLTRFTGTIRSSITLLDGRGGHITRNAYSSVYSKAVLPIYGVPQTLLDDALAEMLQPAATLLVQKMR